MRTLNGKFMEEKLKHCWTLKQLANYFQVSEEKFLKMLEDTFSTKAYKGMISRLRKNEKTFQRKHSSKSNSDTLSTEESIPIPTSFEEESPQKDIQLDTQEHSNKDSETFETLKLQRENLQFSLNELELKHKTLTSERAQIKKEIIRYKTRLTALKEELHECHISVCCLVEKLNEKLDLMKDLNLSISETRQNLSSINTEIESLQKVTIFVYASGDVEFETPLQIEYPSWNNLFDVLIKNDAAGSLTVNQMAPPI